MRVVSLVPSTTETLRAWGHDPIACTRFCEQPDLPHVGGTKDPDVRAIVELAPDLVVMDEEENRHEDALALEVEGIDLLITAVRSVTDVGPTLERLAAAVGATPSLETQRTALAAGAQLTAFVPIWRRPWMTINGDTYGSSLLASMGVANIYGHAAARYPTVDLEEVKQRRPDVVLAPSEPYPFAERHRPDLAPVAPVVFVDGRDLFWWGVRTVAATERLAGVLSEFAGR